MKSPAAMPYRKILVLQTGFIGDMVLTTPLLRALRRAAPGAAITLLHAPRAGGVVRHSPRIDRRIVFDKENAGAAETIRLARRLARDRYDLVLSPHRSLRSGLLALGSGAERRIGFDHHPSALFYTDVVPYNRWESTFVRRKLRLLEPLGIEEADETPEVRFGEEDEAAARALLEEAALFPPFAVLAVGSAWATKRWPPERFGALSVLFARRGIASLLVGGEGDRESGARAAAAGCAVDRTGRTPIEVLMAILARAALFVGNDSGALHLARAARVPSVALFGPTGPEQFRFDSLVCVVRSDAPCAPCSDHGSKSCPRRDWICLPAIDAARVDAAARRLVKDGAAGGEES